MDSTSKPGCWKTTCHRQRAQRRARLLAADAGRAIDHLNRLRERLRERMQQALSGQRYGRVLIALAIGDQRGERKQTGRCSTRLPSHCCRSAPTSLFATGWIGWLTLAGWQRSPRLTWLPAQRAAALVATVVCVTYAMAGFEVPAQRTCPCCSPPRFRLMLRRTLSPWLILVLALTVVLAIDPTLGRARREFLVSFGAVALPHLVPSPSVASAADPWLALRARRRAAVARSAPAPLSWRFVPAGVAGGAAGQRRQPFLLVTLLVVHAHAAAGWSCRWIALLLAAHQLVLLAGAGLLMAAGLARPRCGRSARQPSGGRAALAYCRLRR